MWEIRTEKAWKFHAMILQQYFVYFSHFLYFSVDFCRHCCCSFLCFFFVILFIWLVWAMLWLWIVTTNVDPFNMWLCVSLKHWTTCNAIESLHQIEFPCSPIRVRIVSVCVLSFFHSLKYYIFTFRHNINNVQWEKRARVRACVCACVHAMSSNTRIENPISLICCSCCCVLITIVIMAITIMHTNTNTGYSGRKHTRKYIFDSEWVSLRALSLR